MKIILISNTIAPNSGWGTLTYNHASYLHKRGVPFQLFLPWNAKRIDVPFVNQISYELPSLLPVLSCWRNILKFLKLLIIKKTFSEPVIIHSLIDFPYNLTGWYWAKKNKCPFIYSAIGSYSVKPFTKIIQRQLLLEPFKKASRVIAISNFTAQQAQKVSNHYRSIDVINLPVTQPSKITASQEDHFNIPESAKVILSVGPLKSRKGMDILIKALPEIVNKISETQLIIVGNGDKEKYYQLAESLGVRKNLLILQNTPAEELIYLFKRSNVFALTSRYINHNFEGYGLVYLEAGLYKKPVVAADSGGVSDAVHHQETGLLVPENNIEATADALIKILSNEELAQKLGEGNYRLAKERNWDDYIDQIIKIYRLITKDQGEHV